MSLYIEDYVITDNFIALKFNNNSNVEISLKTLREICPCAHCSGESDVFGNNYKPEKQPLTDLSFKITLIKPIGNYAIQIFWKDGHSTGIYTFNFLKSLNE